MKGFIDPRIIFLILMLTVGAGSGGGSTVSYNQVDDICSLVYDFILEHYNPQENKLEFTEEDFDFLQLQTTRLPNDLKNYIQYYDDLCDQELPFINYNNEWPLQEEEIIKEQSVTEGFDDFLNTLKSDSRIIIIVILSFVGIIYLIGRYS